MERKTRRWFGTENAHVYAESKPELSFRFLAKCHRANDGCGCGDNRGDPSRVEVRLLDTQSSDYVVTATLGIEPDPKKPSRSRAVKVRLRARGRAQCPTF